MIEMAGACKENGMSTISFNHYAPAGEKNLRLINMCEDKYLDEVIQYADERFNPEEIYLCGFSLGGNHILRYLGSKKENVSNKVKAALTIGTPFDCTKCATKLKNTHFGIYNMAIT